MARRTTALVMSATIAPPRNTPYLCRCDPSVRLDDYCQALRFYLGVSDDLLQKIIFIENSGSDLTPLERLCARVAHRKQVEFIGFDGNDHPPEYGKGYGEFRLLDYGLSRSLLLGADDMLWKVTGRLRVLNIEHLIRTAPASYAVYCDLRSVPLIGEKLGGNRWMDLRIFSCTVAAYDWYMRGHFEDLRSDRCHAPERFFFDLLQAAGRDVVPRFRVQPQIAGYGGHRDVDYQGGAYTVKHAIRAASRRLTPWLWL